MSPADPINRNDPCPCGSGKKYKKCCLVKSPGGGASASAAGPGKRGGGGARPRGATAGRTAGASGGNPQAILIQAVELHRAGRIGHAEHAYRQVLAQRPRDVTALIGLGQIRSDLGFREEAVDLLRRAVAADAKRFDAQINLADLLHRIGRYEEGLAVARRAVALDGHSAPAFTLVAICLSSLNRLDEASTAIRKAIALVPRDANAAIVCAQIDRRRGDLEAARARLEPVVARAGIDPFLHEMALQELGMVLDGLGEHDLAWSAFEQSGREQLASTRARRIDADMWTRRITCYREGLTPDLVRVGERLGPDDDHPVPNFIVGFSRSGTTMIEQVIAAHPGEVVTTDEEPILRTVKKRLFERFGVTSTDDVPALLKRLDAGALRAMRDLYWSEAEAFAGGPLTDRVFIDKLPLNLIDIGFINAIFPEARVLVMIRDPRDVCLSCFMQWFHLQAANVRLLTIEHTAAFYAEVMALWLHVRPMLSLRFIEVKYEDTVADLEREARRVVELFGLPWDAALLDFHEKARHREISTPSSTAVGEKIHTRAVARWRRYERHLAPVMGVLRPYVEAFGYDT